MLPSRLENLIRWSTNFMHIGKKLPLVWITGRANILFKYLTFTFFNLGCGFYSLFSVLFAEAPASCDKEILK